VRIRELRLRPWLTAIVVNLARNKRRRIADRRPAQALPSADDQPGPEPMTSPADAPESIHGRRAARDRWVDLLATVPERYRLPLVLRHVDDLSYTEIAQALGRPEGTLKAQVHRGLAILRAAAESIDREELTA
jgi:RNA polymerase sigma-70 factor (ECF subfamily)